MRSNVHFWKRYFQKCENILKKLKFLEKNLPIRLVRKKKKFYLEIHRQFFSQYLPIIVDIFSVLLSIIQNECS